MKSLVTVFLLALALPLAAAVETGQKAPDFTLTDISGKSVSLSDYAGKTVVLEWTNPGCPFVRKFYADGGMPGFQKKAQEKGVVWLTINSTHPSQGDFLNPEASAKWAKEHGHAATWLLDPEGTVGKAYGAVATPNMYVIDPDGVLVYQGAIDSIRDANPESIAKADNYVMAALKALEEGTPVSDPRTRPYGCNVKYAN